MRARARRSGTASTARRGPPPCRSPTSPSRTPLRPSSPSTIEDAVDSLTDSTAPPALDLDDIQAGALHERPSPYVGAYLLLRIDDRRDGRELVRRLLPLLAPGRSMAGHVPDAWL